MENLLLTLSQNHEYVGEIPSFKLFESDKVLAFLDITPLSRGHAVRSPFLPRTRLEPKYISLLLDGILCCARIEGIKKEE